MKQKLLLFASASVFALAGTAVAGQPLKLSDAQMDRVAAGTVGSAALANAASTGTPSRSASRSACCLTSADAAGSYDPAAARTTGVPGGTPASSSRVVSAVSSRSSGPSGPATRAPADVAAPVMSAVR